MHARRCDLIDGPRIALHCIAYEGIGYVTLVA